MQMRHCLAGCWAVIDAYVHGVRLHLQLDELDRRIECRAETLTLETGEVGKDLDVAPWDHEQMAVGHWIAIPAEEERSRFVDNIAARREIGAERARGYGLRVHVMMLSIALAILSKIMKSPGTSL